MKLVVALLGLGVIMTPLPEGRLQPYRDDAIVWPIADETNERMVDRWLTNYCTVIEEACPMLIPYWAGWGWQYYGPRGMP